MPVIPPGVAPFAIRPPCTAGDSGAPSSSLTNDVDRVFLLIEDERHLTAHALLTSVQQRIQEWEDRRRLYPVPPDQKTKKLSKKEKENLAARERNETARVLQIQAFLKTQHTAIHKLENRCRLFRRAQQNLQENDDWTFASNHFGITTYYRREEDDSLSIKLEGEVKDAALFELVCVLKEVDLHYHWAPFCSSSLTIADLDKLDLIGWFLIGMPKFGMARDGCFRAVGCDNMQEDGSILLAGQGIHDIMPDAPQPEDTFLSSDPVLENLSIPPIPTRVGSGRMTIRKFEAAVHVTSPTSCNTKIVANLDPNISFLPNSILEFAMKHLAGVMLSRLQAASKKAVQQPVTNVHAVKMREERDFYQKWLMAKFQCVCEAKGWEMPPVAAFQLSEQRNHDHHRYEFARPHTFGGVSSQDNIADGFSAARSFVVKESDSMSLLSNNTGKTSVRNNPISSYLRDMELKVQRRKEEQVAAVRLRSAERLLPKALPTDKNERLNELRNAKARRTGLSTVASTSSDVDFIDQVTSQSVAQRLFHRLYSHAPGTRFAVIVSLVFVEFIMLHPEPLWRFSELHPGASWVMLLAQDTIMILYIFMCAVPHFLLCDAALVYSFDGLELGSKTGQHVKTFYSDKVRAAVAAGSLGIVGASVAKAALKFWTRLILWAVSRVVLLVHNHVFSQIWSYAIELLNRMLPGEFKAILQSLVWTPIFWISAILSVPFQWIWTFTIHSNPVGRGIVHSIRLFWLFFQTGSEQTTEFVSYSVDAIDGKISIVPWRLEAFYMARSLFMYTSVFLVTTLVLFHMTAQKPPLSDTVPTQNGAPIELVASASSLESEESAKPNDATSRNRNGHASSSSLQAVPEMTTLVATHETATLPSSCEKGLFLVINWSEG